MIKCHVIIFYSYFPAQILYQGLYLTCIFYMVLPVLSQVVQIYYYLKCHPIKQVKFKNKFKFGFDFLLNHFIYNLCLVSLFFWTSVYYLLTNLRYYNFHYTYLPYFLRNPTVLILKQCRDRFRIKCTLFLFIMRCLKKRPRKQSVRRGILCQNIFSMGSPMTRTELLMINEFQKESA